MSKKETVKCPIKKAWIKSEMEHTKNKWFAEKIVKDHIREYGCDYYPRLTKLQTDLKRRSK